MNSRGSLLAIAIVVLLAASCDRATTSPPPSSALWCAPVEGRTLTNVAWDANGTRAVLVSMAADMRSELEVIDWPSRRVLNVVDTGEFDTNASAIDPDGNVYWLRTHTGPAGDSADLVRAGLDGTATVLGTYAGAFLELHWGGSPTAVEVGDAGERLVELRTGADQGTVREVVPWKATGTGFWVSRTGDPGAWLEQKGVGEPLDLVVRTGRDEVRHRLPGSGGRSASLYPPAGVAIYVRTETGRLTVLDLKDNSTRGEVDARQFREGEVSATGILAALTAGGDHEVNQLCTLDFQTTLATGTLISEPSAPPLSEPDLARKARFLAWLPRPTRTTVVDLRLGLGADWDTIAFIPPTYDNVAAEAHVGAPFDVEQAAQLVRPTDNILVLARGLRVVAWFAVAPDEFDVSNAVGGSLGPEEGACIDAWQPEGGELTPRLVGLPGTNC